MKRTVLALGALLALLPAISNAALMVMVDGVAGPNKQSPYGGWFVADSFTWGYERANTAKPFAVTISMEQSGIGFASIAQAAFSGAILKKIVIDVVTVTGPENQLMVLSRLTCEEAQVRRSSTAGDEDDMPRFELEFGCAKFAWENFERGKDGIVTSAGKGSWNFRTNTP